MKNWRNAEDYPSVDSLSPGRWAWEFLRRNQDYREDWEKKLEIWNSEVAKGEIMAPNYPEVDDRRFNIPAGIFSPFDECKARWGLSSYVNPDQDDPIKLGFEVSFGPLIGKEFIFDEPQLMLRLDINRPISPQLNVSKPSLLRFQKILKQNRVIEVVTPRGHRNQWTRYLRVLDARSAGASYEEIAGSVISEPGPDDDPRRIVEGILKQARRMMRSGYRNIILPTKDS